MKQKLFTLLLAVAASVGTMFASTKIGDLYYNLNATNHTAEVTYKSYINYKCNEGWGITTAIIPTSVTYNSTTYRVTSIGVSAFEGCTSLTSVTIPNSVTSIGLQAFYRCTGLTSITIGSGVTSCGQYAFDGCTSLTAVHISDLAAWCNISCYYSGSSPLAYAHNLYLNGELVTDLIIPNGVTSIGVGAFNGCTSLTSITIPSSVTSIGNYAFGGCTGLTSVTINSNAIMSKTYTDSGNIKNIFGDQVAIYTIGTDVVSIGNYAFYGCSGLTSVTIGNSVTSIGYAAFYGCSGLTSVTIPNSVTSIGANAFRSCSGLTSVTIPNSVTSIGAYAFDGCNLTSVTIPNSVTSIEKNAFAGCTSLTSVTIPNSVTSIGEYAFASCSSLASITIPNSVTSIGYRAFSGCSGLTSIEIPNSVTSIGSSAFGECSGLTTMTCNAITPPSCGNLVFIGVNCSMIPLHVPEQSISVYKSKSPWNGFNPIISTNKISIKYVNWDGTEILSSEVTKGSMPQYSGATPTREATTELTYSFAGWTPEIVVATKDATYTATYNSSPRLYTITWLQDDGSLIDKTTVAYGKIPTHANPTKAETVGFTYTFRNWTPTITAVTGNATYRATYSSTRKSYTITWLNEDGSLIDKTTVEYGKTPTHANPTKAATAEFTYTFAGWTPNVVAVTGDATYTATFNSSVNKYGISATAINGSVNGVGTYPYGTQVELTAVPNYGYHFTQWSDGNTDNPRTVVLTQNMTFTAEFAVDKSGTCGKNNLLQWRFADDGTLTISGSGELTENYTFGVEAPTQMQQLVVGNEVTSIGERAFYEKTTLQKLIIGSNVTSIGKYAFASINNRQLTSLVMPAELLTIGDYAFSGNTYLESIDFNAKLQSIGAYAFKDCYRVSEMTCLATVTPDLGTDALASINSYASLCVPAECLRKYQVDPNWGRFDLCELGTTSTVTENRTVTVEPTDNTAIFTWPTENNAASYSLQITKDGVVFCTLVFNSNGQLTGIAFAPGRNGAALAPAATMSVAGMSFTVTGLDGASKYAYRLAVTNDASEELVAYSGEFATTGYDGEVNPGGNPEGIEDIFTDEHKASKILRDGQIFILRGEKVYTLTGQEVR